MADNNFNNKINIDNYTDLEGTSTKDLTRALWLLEHKEILRKSLLIFLILVGAVSWSYTIYGFAYYFFIGTKQDNKLLSDSLASPAISHQLILQLQPQALQVGTVMVFNSSGDKYDFLTQLVNPNLSQSVTFDYYFQTDYGPTDKLKGFILPADSKYLIGLGQTFSAMPVGANLIIENLNWRRLDPRKISDWPSYKASHLNLEVKDIKFIPARATGLSEKIGLSQLEFNAINDSAYNFWQVDFIALMYGQGSIIGVNRYSATEFKSGESRLVQVNYPDQLGRVDKIEVIPEINILDNSIYKDFHSGNLGASNN